MQTPQLQALRGLLGQIAACVTEAYNVVDRIQSGERRVDEDVAALTTEVSELRARLGALETESVSAPGETLNQWDWGTAPAESGDEEEEEEEEL